MTHRKIQLRVLVALFTFLAFAGCERASVNQNIPWIENFDAALDRAKADNKPVMVDFVATWCGPCRQMDRQTYTDASVEAALTNWISAKIDVDKHQEVARRFGIDSIPTTVILQPDGKETTRASGYMGPEDFVAFLKKSDPRGNPGK